MARSRSSARWLQRHLGDPYVRRAQAQGYRSRAAYKLLEIDRRDRLLRAAARVVDLGAAPGGWTQVAAGMVRPGGRVVAVDLLAIAPISGVTILQGDFRDPRVQDAIRNALGGDKADVVLSDLSPNITGVAPLDQARAAELAQAVIEFCRAQLRSSGVLLLKAFHGAEFGALTRAVKEVFRDVQARKPAASRGESRETYLLAKGLKNV